MLELCKKRDGIQVRLHQEVIFPTPPGNPVQQLQSRTRRSFKSKFPATAFQDFLLIGRLLRSVAERNITIQGCTPVLNGDLYDYYSLRPLAHHRLMPFSVLFLFI